MPLLSLCFETKKALLGSTNESVLTLQHTLASVYAALREHSQAETLFVISLTSVRQLYGENHVRTAAAAAALADLYSKMGRMAQAAKFYRCAVSPCSSQRRGGCVSHTTSFGVAGKQLARSRRRWGRVILKR